MKVVASKIRFYGIFLWRKTKSPPELIGNLVSKALLLQYDLTGGSGTTLISAINNGRTGIGIEYNSDFSDLIKYRIGEDTNLNLFEKENLQLSFNNGEFIESSSIQFYEGFN